jgi:tetratricopeptide (TPR) repeat protein
VSAREAFEAARLLAVRGESELAKAALDRALGDDPRHLGALLLKASLELEARHDEAALSLCAAAVAAWPRSSEAWNGLARCRHHQGDDPGALAAAEEARRLLDEAGNGVQAAPVYLTLVWCLRGLRRFREALAAADEGLRRVPDAVLAEWAGTVEAELAEAQKERC